MIRYSYNLGMPFGIATKRDKQNRMLNKQFIAFPILVTERLTLRQLSSDDKQEIFALRSSVDVNKYLDRALCKNIDDALLFINKINASIQQNYALYWVITLTATTTFVGTICLYNFSSESNSCEIGYELLPSFQDQGMMKEAAEKVIDYAFNTVGVEKIEACSHIENTNSTKLLEKLGFVKLIAADTKNEHLSMFTLTNLLDITK